MTDTASCPLDLTDAHDRPQVATGCVYCGGTAGRLVFRDVCDRLAYAPGSWSFWRCETCGSLSLSPMPRAEELATFYPPVYCYTPDLGNDSWAKRWLCDLEYRLLYRPMYRSDAKRVAVGMGHAAGTGKRLLDVGCGRGLRLLALRDMGYEVAGVDFSAESVRYLEEQLGIPAVRGDAGDLGAAFAPSSFDVVTAHYLLEHVVDPAELVRQCLRLLKPGGWLVVAVPLADSIQAALFGSRWCQVREAPRHVAIPSQKAMHLLAHASGCGRVHFVADSSRYGAASIALTLVPQATACAVYGHRRFWAMLTRGLGVLTAAALLPWCWLENMLFRRPACGLLFMQKSEAAP